MLRALTISHYPRICVPQLDQPLPNGDNGGGRGADTTLLARRMDRPLPNGDNGGRQGADATLLARRMDRPLPNGDNGLTTWPGKP